MKMKLKTIERINRNVHIMQQEGRNNYYIGVLDYNKTLKYWSYVPICEAYKESEGHTHRIGKWFFTLKLEKFYNGSELDSYMLEYFLMRKTNNAIERTEFGENKLTGFFFEKLITRHKNSYYNATPIIQAIYLHEIFNYNICEEVRLEPLSGNLPTAFSIRKRDIEFGGKFNYFKHYSLLRLGKEFNCSVKLS